MEIQQNTLQILKEKLRLELSKPNSDSTLILTLSNQIADLDTKNIRFSVDAGIVNRLGKELVAKAETAVSELVKNAYDADANIVDLVFEYKKGQPGKLTIDDDGMGMEQSQLINGFMRISSPEKILNPVSEKYQRKKAGKKGIGRFATHRLGEKLTIITQTLESTQAIMVTIDWTQFEIQSNIQYIPNLINWIPKQKPHGTSLIIEGLRENWNTTMIKRVYRYISELLQPFPLPKTKFTGRPNNPIIDTIDPGFKASCFWSDSQDLYPIEDEQANFYSHALAEIEGFVTEDGQGMWSVKSDKIDLAEEIKLIGQDMKDETKKFKYIQNIHFKAYYFIYEKSLIPSTLFTKIRELGNELGGIRIYHNGFRVLPYGEKENDWLRLGESVRRRSILPVHSTNNFFGFVELNDEGDQKFEELANREGIIESPAFQEIEDFVYNIIILSISIIAERRGKKVSAGQKNWKKDNEEQQQNINLKVEEVKDKLAQIDSVFNKDQNTDLQPVSPQEKQVLDIVTDLKKDIEEIQTTTQNQTNQQIELLNELAMLRILAALGLIIGEFVHEIKHFVPELKADAESLQNFSHQYPDLSGFINRVSNNTNLLTTYTSYFDRTVSANELRNIQTIEVREVIRPFYETIKQDLLRSNILMEDPVFIGYDLITLPMHKSEWASILFNFYSNAKKAVKLVESPQIQIKAGKTNNHIYMEFSDNGMGIAPEHDHKIFDAFFTTSSPNTRHQSEAHQEITGAGLGLKIVRDIVESYGGSIAVKRPSNSGFNTTIRIEIPQN